MAFELPDLPYAYDALEPHIDAETMRIHHDLHHGAYVTNANAALEGTEWADASVESVLTNLDALPADKQAAVRNNVGGHANHSLFWQIMGPDGGGEPGGALRSAIDDTFGSFEELRAAVNDGGVKRFGSGWTWLVWDGTGLAVYSTRTRTPPSRRATCPCSGSTSGSTRTTSSIRTSAPPISRRGGTSSTGPRSSGASRRHRTSAAIQSEARMRKDRGDMEIALEVPQSRLRAVPAETRTSRTAGSVRRGAARARRRARPRRLRGPVRPLRQPGLQPRPAQARRPRARRGRRSGGVRGHLALRLDVSAGARRGRRLAVHGRAERDRRPAAPQRAADRRGATRARVRASRARRSRQRTRTSRGASIAPSRSSCRASAR